MGILRQLKHDFRVIAGHPSQSGQMPFMMEVGTTELIQFRLEVALRELLYTCAIIAGKGKQVERKQHSSGLMLFIHPYIFFEQIPLRMRQYGGITQTLDAKNNITKPSRPAGHAHFNQYSRRARTVINMPKNPAGTTSIATN